MNFQEALQWRYATKQMNGEKISQELVDQIIDAAYWAPTSSGLQPFCVIEISNPEIRAKIQPIVYNQPQITDGSHVLVFAAWDKYTDERIDFIFHHMNEQRNLPQEGTIEYVKGLKNTLFAMSEEEQAVHAAKQSYIGFGMAIAQAALLKVDATPMEGFDNKALDEFLGLDKQGLRSTVLLTLGKRNEENDWLVNLKKVRHPKEMFLKQIK